MLTEAPVRIGTARASEVARCPRMGGYSLLGFERVELDERSQRLVLRGRMLHDWKLSQLVERYGDGVEIERRVAWPHGELREDALILDPGIAVEIKTTTALRATDAYWLQLAFAVRYDDAAEAGCLVLVHPATLEERVLPFRLTAEWSARVDGISDALTDVREAAVDPPSPSPQPPGLPERICAHPGEAASHFCPFAGPCFDGWQYPPAEELAAEHAGSIAALVLVERRRKALASELRAAEEERAGIRDTLRPLLRPRFPYTLGGVSGSVTIKRTESAGRVLYDVADAVSAGQLDADALAPFTRVGKPSERWTVVEHEGGALPAPDYGEVPF